MKRLITVPALLLAFAAALPASAADLTLTDGRTFRDASIVSQSPRKVVIKHADGLSGVEKTLLPAELSARYPIDEAAAREAERRSAEARAHAAAFHKAEAERAALIRLEREQTALANAQLAALEASNRLAEAEAARIARQRTEVVYEYVSFNRSYPYSVYTHRRADDCTPRWNDKPHHRDNRFVNDRHDHSRRDWSTHTTDTKFRAPHSTWQDDRPETASRSRHRSSNTTLQNQRTDDERRQPQKTMGSLVRR